MDNPKSRTLAPSHGGKVEGDLASMLKEHVHEEGSRRLERGFLVPQSALKGTNLLLGLLTFRCQHDPADIMKVELHDIVTLSEALPCKGLTASVPPPCWAVFEFLNLWRTNHV